MTTDTIPVPHMQRLLEALVKRKFYAKPKFEVSKGSNVGDNYLGVLYRVQVTEEDAATTKPGLSLIFKGMPASPKRREACQAVNFFSNEYTMYKVVLPAFADYLADKGALERELPFPFSPKCHDATTSGPEGEDTLVLEDMRPHQYTMHDRRVGLSVEYCRVVLQGLAHLHATSLAMEADRPKEFARLRDMVKETLFLKEHPWAQDINKMAARAFEYIKERFPEGSVGHTKAKAFIDNYFADMSDIVTASPDDINAITHGDCWTNNLLFKHSETGAVQRVCLLDFQLSRYARPVLDILYLIYSCTERSMREQHLPSLLRYYHAQLAASLRALGCDAEDLFPWQAMQDQLNAAGRYGFGMAVMTVPIFLAEVEDIPDLDAKFEEGAEVAEAFQLHERPHPERDNRISDVLQEMLDKGWL